MKTVKKYQVKRQTSAQKYSTKSGAAVNFELKIGTVPLKAGRLESMMCLHGH